MKKFLYLVPVLVAAVALTIHTLHGEGNPAIKHRTKIKTGAVQDVIINGNAFTVDDLRVTTPGTTYKWTPELAQENTLPPNIGPGLADK